MEKLNTEDGQLFIKNLASFIRTHEKALANALQLRRQSTKNVQSPTSSSSSSASTLAAALSSLRLTSQSIKPAKLTLTPHHLFYLLSRFEDISVAVGPMSVRLENIQTDVSQSYVSFLNKPQRSRGDRDSIHSVSSVRSVMSGISSIWSTIGLGSRDSFSKSERAKLALEADLKYLYSAFTKIPCLRLAPDHRARLIRGYEEFPFDTAVPLHSFKNLSALEIIDLDYRSFFGWDRLSEQLRTLTVKRAKLEDPADLLMGVVLDDVDKRRRRSSRAQHSPVIGWNGANPQPVHKSELSSSLSAPGSPVADTGFGTSTSPSAVSVMRSEGVKSRTRAGSISPSRPSSKHIGHRHTHSRGTPGRIRRTGSGSSNSSDTGSSSNPVSALPPSKWRFLRHLGLPDNSLTSITAAALAPVANTLQSLDLSANLFTEIPDSLASLVALRALNLSNCMIESLHSLSRNPLPAITALNLRANRLRSLAGVERLLSLERLDLRDNNLFDPTEIARLTSLPEIREIWVTGNPFVKTHSNYRVVIFNLFRRTPGYSEDIIIDGSGPGYTERKQLVDRVAEPESAPVIRPAPDHSAVAVVSKPANAVQGPVTSKPVQEQAPQNDYEVGSSRRMQDHRRRVVDGSMKNSTDGNGDSGAAVPSVSSVQHVQLPDDPFVITTSGRQWKSDGGHQADPSTTNRLEKKSDDNRDPPALEATESPVVQTTFRPINWNLDEELYQQRLEALKHEVSHSLLTVLGDRVWDQDISMPRTGTNFSDSTMIPPDSFAVASIQPILSGGHP